MIRNRVISMATDRHRYTISIDHELFQKIEDFRFQNRFPTRSEASEALIRLGLRAVENQKKTVSDPDVEKASRP